MKQNKIDFGIDAPLVPIMYFVVGIIALLAYSFDHSYPFAWVLLIYGMFMIAGGAIFLHTSLRGKFLIWNKIIDNLNIAQSPKILDLGCGHGAVLIEFARKIHKPGKVVGVDLWRNVDQANNSSNVTRRNLELAGAADKVDLITADMSDLPLKSESFDIVVSSLAFHNIHPKKRRSKALYEACSVLKSGGQLIIVDTGNHFKDYRAILEEQNFHNIIIKSAGFNGWWTGPWMSTSIIQAEK